MSLSNTATPKYFEAWREKVISGEIPVCREISLEMGRIQDLVDDPRYYFDQDAVEGWINFCENEMVLTDGSDLKLLETFKLWGEELFGWYYFEDITIFVPDEGHGHYEKRSIKHRLINKQYLIVGRGAAKSQYDAMIQAYYLIVDRSTTDQFAIAPTMAQAEETVSPIRTAINRARGPLIDFLTEGSILNTAARKLQRVKLASTKQGIQNFLTNSIVRVRPMRIDKLQGYKQKITTIDEWLSGDTREDVVGAVEQSSSKNKDWLMILTSSEGTVRNSVGDSMKMELLEILRGDYYNPHVSIWYYRLDDISEVGDPRMWAKANPNLGYTVSYETYAQEVERAEKIPETRNDILAKRFGIPTEGYTYYFTYEETLPHNKREFWKMSCALGMDLSQGDDFCAFTFLFPLRVGFGVKTRSYISQRTFDHLSIAQRVKYQEFIDEGSLIVLNGTVIDMPEVYDDIIEHINYCEYDVRSVGYDPYNAAYFIDRWEREHGSYGVVMVRQGARTESVPLGELKQLAEDRILIFDQRIMTYTMGNAITLEDNNGNRKLYRKRTDQKVDNVAAMMDAYVAWKTSQEMFE